MYLEIHSILVGFWVHLILAKIIWRELFNINTDNAIPTMSCSHWSSATWRRTRQWHCLLTTVLLLLWSLAVSTVNGYVASASHDKFVKIWKWPAKLCCTYEFVYFYQCWFTTCMYFIYSPFMFAWSTNLPLFSFYVTIYTNLWNIIFLLPISLLFIFKITTLLYTFFPLISYC